MELISTAGGIRACRDPDDDKFLEVAINGGAEVIISGDAALLELNPFRAVPIIPPAAFVQRVSQSRE